MVNTFAINTWDVKLYIFWYKLWSLCSHHYKILVSIYSPNMWVVIEIICHMHTYAKLIWLALKLNKWSDVFIQLYLRICLYKYVTCTYMQHTKWFLLACYLNMKLTKYNNNKLIIPSDILLFCIWWLKMLQSSNHFFLFKRIMPISCIFSFVWNFCPNSQRSKSSINQFYYITSANGKHILELEFRSKNQYQREKVQRTMHFI